MSLLAAAEYDPATAASAATTSLLAMTALDTTNLRLTVTVPASGFVIVRARVALTGHTTTSPHILLGVLEGSTVVLRMAPVGMTYPGTTLNAANVSVLELYGIIAATPGSHTFDLAYGVEVVASAGGVIKWGGPNDNTGANAWGAVSFEIYDPGTGLLAGKVYDPGTSVSKSTQALSALTALDTTNLRHTFTAPASGNVMWRIRTVITGSNAGPLPAALLGILEGSTVRARQAPGVTYSASGAATFPYWVLDASGVITGVSAGSHTYDAAWGMELAGGSANYAIKYGGPNDATTANNGYGGILFELWAV